MITQNLTNEDLAEHLRTMKITGVCLSRAEREYLDEAADRLERSDGAEKEQDKKHLCELGQCSYQCNGECLGDHVYKKCEYIRLKNAIKGITIDICKTCMEEAEEDKNWTAGLNYSLKIIDRHIKGAKL